MIAYQYYEFQAIVRPLDERAMSALRGITSRATITPTSLVNVYHWGNFKHSDHATIMLHGWHPVVLNTEGQSKAMRNVAFLD